MTQENAKFCSQGAATVHFQDFNAEVLKCLTIPNFNANIQKESKSGANDVAGQDFQVEARFFAGDWRNVHQLLPYTCYKEEDGNSHSGQDATSGYDIILMAETVYSISVLQSLYHLIKKVSIF